MPRYAVTTADYSNLQRNDGEKRQPRAKQSDGEKLIIRRLPPGMTHDEFSAILGPEWALSNGKVDWLSYVPGKLSTEYASLTQVPANSQSVETVPPK